MKNLLLKEGQTRELYVQELIEKEGIEVKNNTLILSPVGSGKSVSIKSDIKKIRESGDKRAIVVLSSLTALKNNQMEEFSEDFETLSRITEEILAETDNKVFFFTYAGWSKVVKFDDSVYENIAAIYCDEIHSLFQFESYGKSDLNIVIRDLFKIRRDTRVLYFTATDNAINEYYRKNEGFRRVFDRIEILNLNDRLDIKRYVANSVFEYKEMEALRGYLSSWKRAILEYGFKAFIYTQKIEKAKLWKEFLVSMGYEADRIAIIWSENSDKKMDIEMSKTAVEMLSKGLIPEGYDIVIFNAAYREGWNLKDGRVKFAVIDTRDETDFTQALGRLRMDIVSVAVLSDVTTGEVLVPEEFLNIELDGEAKDVLANKLCVLDKRNKKMGFVALRKYLTEKGYIFEDKRTKAGRFVIVSAPIESDSYDSEIERVLIEAKAR